MKAGKLYKIKGSTPVYIGRSTEVKLMARTYKPGQIINIDHSCSWLDDGIIVLLIETGHDAECKILYNDTYYNISKEYLIEILLKSDTNEE